MEEGVRFIPEQTEPSSPAAPPLLQGKKQKNSNSDQRCCCSCCSRNKKKILIIGSVSVILIITALITAYMLLPTIGSKPSKSSNKTLLTCHHQNQSSVDLCLPDLYNQSSLEHPVEQGNIMGNGEKASSGESNPLLAFVGNWRLDSQENLDDYLKAIGVGYFQRMMAPSIRNEMDITVSGPAELTLKSKVIIVTTSIITFNKEFEEKTADGRHSKSIHTVEGKKWVKIERWNADGREKNAKYIREIINDELKVTAYVDEVILTRTYVRIVD